VARPIAKDHREKRSAILKQAAVYFADHGYDRASVNGVAGACGISKSLIICIDDYDIRANRFRCHKNRGQRKQTKKRCQ